VPPVLPLTEVVWRDGAGIAFQRPEITLAWKAKHRRVKDDLDFARTWPLLDSTARTWLRGTVARLHSDHPWLTRIDASH